MPRTHAYAKIGERCYGKQDWQAKGRTNVIGAYCDKKMLTTCLFDCNIDSDCFYSWLVDDLIPKLPEQSVLVMDNATFHKRQDMIHAIRQAGHKELFLPPYSPDLNPIEHAWAQAKSIRRKYQCSVPEVFQKYMT